MPQNFLPCAPFLLEDNAERFYEKDVNALTANSRISGSSRFSATNGESEAKTGSKRLFINSL